MSDQDSPPLPKGSYNFNFDDFDENTNPFETKSKVKALDNDIDPFKPSKTLSLSPTTSNNNIVDSVNNDSIKHGTSRNKIPRSPIQSPDSQSDEHQAMHDSSPEQLSSADSTQQPQPSSAEPTVSAEPQPLSSDSPPNEVPKQSPKKPVIKKGIKKPKFKSKLKAPPNFGAQDDEIEIFAPPPPSCSSEETFARDDGGDTSHDLDLANENTPITTNESTADTDIKNKHLLSCDGQGDMTRSVEMFNDFGAHEMPYVENEGISPAPEVFNDSVGLDIAGDAQINSVYLAGNEEQPAVKSSGNSFLRALLKHVTRKSKKVGKEESKENDITEEGDDSSLMSSIPSKTTTRVPKHPAVRVLEGEVEKSDKLHGEEGEDLQYYDAYEYPPSDSSRVRKIGMKERMEKTDSIVQLVQDGASSQVLKYSQSDWNKMKQELELDFQTRLLNKEREWGKKLADKEKVIGHMKEENKLLQQSSNDMRMIVTEFEKTIAQLQAEAEKTTNQSQSNMEDIIKDRDQAIDDLQGVEMAFSDLHRRYEKTKGVVEGFKKNEEVLKKCIEDYQQKLKKSEDKLQTIKQQAEEKLDLASIEMDKLRRSTSSDMARLEAAMRKSDLQVASLQKSLDQKIKENEELTAICDELIAKVGSD